MKIIHAKFLLKILTRPSLCYSTLFILFQIHNSEAQLIQTGLNESGTFAVGFNPSVIKEKKIKFITRHISNKPDNQLILDKGLIEQEEFDTTGHIISSYFTEIKSTAEKDIPVYRITGKGIRIPSTKTEYSYLYDTTFVFYKYDSLGRLKIKRNSVVGREIFKCFYYEYDLGGNIKKETVTREVNKAENIKEYTTGMQTVLSVESFSYENLIPGQIRKKFFNDENIVYKEGIIHTDEQGHVLEESFDFVVTWIKERNNYKYNDKGLLIEKNVYSNEGYSIQEKFEYETDNTGLITGLILFKDGIKTNTLSFLYDNSTKLLQSEVNRDYKNLSIKITRYDYICF